MKLLYRDIECVGWVTEETRHARHCGLLCCWLQYLVEALKVREFGSDKPGSSERPVSAHCV